MNFNKFKKSLITVTLCCTVFSFNGKLVYAEDPYVYPGIHCAKYSGGISSFGLGSIANPNTSNGSSIVVCPTSFDSANSIDGGFVRVNDRNPTRDFACILVSGYYTDSGYLTVFLQQRTSTGIGVQTLSFSRMSHKNSKGHVVIRCTIPAYNSEYGESVLSTYSVNP